MKAAVIILALAVSSFVAVASEPSAKDLFKQGENCLKASQVFEAYNAFVAASLKEPSSKKYQSKVLEVGRMASKLAEAEGRRLLATLPTEAHLWFQRAVVFDKG